MLDDHSLKLGELVAYLVGLVLAVLAWIGKNQVKRIDGHDKTLAEHSEDITEIKAGALTKDDITHMEVRITNAIAQSAAHTAERIGDVARSVDKAHARIDAMRDR